MSEKQNDQIILYDIKALEKSIDYIVDCISYRDKEYEQVKAIVEATESIKLSFKTLDKLQEMIKKAHKEKEDQKVIEL